MTNYPWPIDKAVEEIEREYDEMTDESMFYAGRPSFSFVRYLLTRLKIAERERGEWERVYYDSNGPDC